ncbi:vWA domain-containing protein [Saccharopolyspora endophytica]|uniref:VWA domain-containing protein n=1 Tax=Saccharopolyspora endophytica TaxID=543886 RepID=A0ABS5D9V8_9PSEU|nr:vWA domain-containing protein [Saccharopolyspora endophytica]MBQ0923071.1 VWA domain-containing protein [Saccharopolyspora endophytica]
MTVHVTHDDAATPTPTDTAETAWQELSAALTDEAPDIAGRDDLVVTITPGAGGGAPGRFLPHQATIELDGTHLGKVDPATVAPAIDADRVRYPVTWGVFAHECAHAAHSRWEPPGGTPPSVIDAAMSLEESRIEAVHVRRRPDDRTWLRAASTKLILEEVRATSEDRASAAHTAALLLARADAGILVWEELGSLTSKVRELLGTDTLRQLREIWQEAHRTADDDTDAMIELGRRWCAALGTDPDATPPKPGTTEPDGTPTPLAKAVTAALTEVDTNTTAALPGDHTAEKAQAKRDEEKARHTALRTAARIFSTDTPGSSRSAVSGTRAPTTEERQAARRLARSLSTAGIRDRTTVKTNSATPPGRLRMRGALAADAQRAAGAMPTAEPFTRISRQMTPAPPLRLGIACDVSGSMRRFAKPVASAAWILAHAARHTQVDAVTATVIFGRHVHPITYPDTAPANVSEFNCRDDWEDLSGAVEALDGALELAAPGAARLLVIVSDGDYRNHLREQGQRRIDRLRAHGCGVLWLVPDRRSSKPLDGVTVLALDDPAATAQAIGRSATQTLRAAR